MRQRIERSRFMRRPSPRRLLWRMVFVAVRFALRCFVRSPRRFLAFVAAVIALLTAVFGGHLEILGWLLPLLL